ncbi:MAG: aminoglycoside phosphotransferase family protein [Anaerolineae bacterium]|nr:aminoglycoside phosphotransferase family protein [Anaerolineae bacterium]
MGQDTGRRVDRSIDYSGETPLTDIAAIAAQFEPTTDAQIAYTEPLGAGNINDTYLVQLERGGRFVLQRINQKVFPHPELIMANLRAVMEHVVAKAGSNTLKGSRRWELPGVVPAHDGQDYVIDDQGDFWRALTFIEGARTYPKINDARHAGEAGFGLGTFQRQISDLDVGVLHDTLPGFHIIPHYLRLYDGAVREPVRDTDTPEIRYGMAFVATRRDWAPVLQDACAAGRLRERPIHGDPKIDNIMIDDETGLAVSIIDLDTVKPGLVQYDIGDCLRSCCNPLGEDAQDLDQVSFELDLCESILTGYLPEVKEFYSAEDYAQLYNAVRVLAFEMGLRFFTDYLRGDVYFKTRYPEHNLMRGLVQFRLAESIEAQEPRILRMIRGLTKYV